MVAIQRYDGAPCRGRDIRDDAELGPALTAAGAVRQPAGIWLDDHEPGADPETDLRKQWLWAIPQLNVTRSHANVPCQLAVRSLMVVSTHISAWGTDVSSLIALALGYGSNTTTALSRLSLGEDARDDPQRNSDSETSRSRASIAADLLTDPTGVGDLLVWAHATTGTPKPILERLAESRGAPLVIYLRPTDLLHTYLIHRVRGRNDRGDLEERRVSLDEAVAESGRPTATLEAGFPQDLDPTGRLTRDIRDAFLERSMLLALGVLALLNREYGGPTLDDLHDGAPQPFKDAARRYDASIRDSSAPLDSLTPNRQFR